MKFQIHLAVLLLAALFLSVSCMSGSSQAEEAVQDVETVQEAEAHPMGFNPGDFDSLEGTVNSGETFASLLQRFGLPSADAHAMVPLCGGVFDLRRLRADNKVTAYYGKDSLDRHLEYFVYSNDRLRSTIFKCRDSLSIWTYERPTHSQRLCSDVTITSSLWNDMLEAGTSPLLFVELSDIYAWTINFFALQKNDRFRTIYSQRVCDDGEVVAIDSVFFCVYDSGSLQSVAVRFDQGDGGNKYWNEKGESMRKAFLKAPLKFNRISSRFSYHRKHPVTGKVRAHTAVDYAAPKGTPVHSIGDGTVTMCGWDPTGGGNRIKIMHMNGYETSYMHLSGFARGIRKGSRVAQGQLIGYVGSTGTSTGPHLDFRVWKDKTPVDPLRMIAPPSEPLKKENMDSLRALVAAYMEELAK